MRARFGWLAMVLMLAACNKSAPPAALHAPRASGYPQPHHLIGLLTVANPRLEETAALMAAAGNAQEKRAAALQLIREAETIASDAWRDGQTPMMRRITNNAVLARGQELSWLDDWQKRHLVLVYDAMKRLGDDTVLDHCRAVVKDEGRRATQKQLALAVLAAHEQVSHGAPPRPTWGMPVGPSDRLARAPATTFGGPATGVDEPHAAAPTTPSIQTPRVEGGAIINVSQVVDALLPYFKICYERSLAQNGRFGAWISLTATVDTRGHVVGVKGSGDDGVPHDMMRCLEGVVVQALFAPPVGGVATVALDLSFTVPPNYVLSNPS